MVSFITHVSEAQVTIGAVHI